jgi:excisionase family DNA binding protein
LKSYNVKQIADMLNTNPETVRRWIREGKLKAVQISRKDGNVIEENEFQRFLKVSPKYARISLSPSKSKPLTVGEVVGTAIGSLVGSLVMGYCDDRINRDFQISTSDIEKYINESIASHEANIKKKSQTINLLIDEITEERKLIDNMKLYLERSKMNDVSENMKDSKTEENKKDE